MDYGEFLNGLPDFGEFIAHLGVAHDANPPGRGSGRYPFGQGNRPHQHDWDLSNRISKLEAAGMKSADIAAALGYYRTDEYGNVIKDKDGNPLGSTKTLKAVKQMTSNAKKMDEFDEISYYWNAVNPDTGKNYTPTEIGRILGMNESSVRTKYTTGMKGNANKVTETATTLKDICDQKGYIDVGKGSELMLSEKLGYTVSPDRLDTALEMLKQEGYTVDTVRIKQVSDKNKETTYRVLAKPGTTYNDIYQNRFDIKSVEAKDGTDCNSILDGKHPPEFIDISRVKIKYAEQGGTERDGEIEIRGKLDKNGNIVAANPDLNLGNARYAQVRIAVDGGKACITDDNPSGQKYIKGMARYSLDLPDGCDVLVNSNKSIKGGPAKALKDLKMDATNPFGSTVVQGQRVDKNGNPMWKIGADGKEHAIPSAVNFVGTTPNDIHVEGAWSGWSHNLPSQFLAKQSLGLVTQQLKLKSRQSEDELQDIRNLNNPVVRKNALKKFGEQCDSDAVSLKAAPIGGQGTKVLMPIPSLKNNECYCPSLPNGTVVAAVRFPHAGPFEIPIMRVNNGNKEGKRYLGDGRDVIGINSHNAAKLSGADFDGDTAVVIPMTRKGKNGSFERAVDIKSAASLPGLDGFDPTARYSTDNPRFSNMVDKKGKPTYHIMTEKEKQIEMGVASNLITDMYAKGCENSKELADAVRYSMVVIDAKKHKLNYQQAYKDFHIQDLKEKYQAHINPETGKVAYGASSLLSRSKSVKKVDARQQIYDINPETGERIYRAPRKTTESIPKKVRVEAPAGYQYQTKDGKWHKSKYLRDENGKEIQATSTGKVLSGKKTPGAIEVGTVTKDGKSTSVFYQAGKGKALWENVGYRKRQQDSTKMFEAKDARQLLSKNPNEIERAYADYANHMKMLGNQARKESVAVKIPKADPKAAKTYAKEVASLNQKLIVAKKNKPRERQAQLLATSIVNAAYKDHPEWDKDDRKKARGQAINQAREITGAKKNMVTFTEKEWEAVNHNAISPSRLNELLENADQDNYMQLAMPKKNRITDAKRSRVKQLYAAGWSYEEIANAVSGVSTSSVANIVNE